MSQGRKDKCRDFQKENRKKKNQCERCKFVTKSASPESLNISSQSERTHKNFVQKSVEGA